MPRTSLPRSVSVPVLRRRLPGRLMGESRKGRRRKILVDSRLKGVRALSTCIHEALHQIDHRLSERTVRQLEKALVFLVIDNQRLFRTLSRHVSRP